MERISGSTLFDVINSLGDDEIRALLREIARLAAALHRSRIAHGDLTTSNMILKDGRVFLIDFGMAEREATVEEMAVDVHMFDESFQSAHNEKYHLIASFYEEYRRLMGDEILDRVDEIRRRRRYV
jgi:Kae1-associated kinase Bud32